MNARRGSVRIAVVGAGDRGWRLACDVMAAPGTELSAVCDRSTAALTRLSPRVPNIPLVSDFSRILEDPTIEAVVIATPVAARYRLATASLAAGKHVLVEHALAASSREAVDLVELGNRLGLVVMPGHPTLYSSPIGYVTSLIESGQLGEVFTVSITRARLGEHRVDTGVVWDLAPCELSVLLTWIDERPAVVSVAGRACIRPGKSDVVLATLAYPSGRIAHLELSWLSPASISRATVVGSEQMVVCDDAAGGCVRVFETGSGQIVTPRIERDDPGGLQMIDFISSVTRGTAPRSNTRTGVEVVRLIEEVERHLSTGAA